MSSLSLSSRRLSLQSSHSFERTLPKIQTRNATLIRRPKRPYTFTQLVTLTDGSSFLHRTTSPSPVYKATKDVRNSPLWNPSSEKLANVEEDEAGKLRAFRERFGRGWDVKAVEYSKEGKEGDTKEQQLPYEDSLMDLISTYGQEAQGEKGPVDERKAAIKAAGKKKKK